LPEAAFAAGFVLARMGRTREAERHLRRAIALRPDFAAAWVNLGSLLREQGRELHAEAALRRAVELRPDLITGWLNLAQLDRQRGRAAEAEAHLKRALDLDLHRVESLLVMSQFCASQHDPAGAWGWLCQAIALSPSNPEAVNTLGILLHNEGRFSEAVQAFQRAEALGSRAAISNRGNSLIEFGRDEEALRAQELAVSRDPHSPGVAYNLALTQLRLGEWALGWPAYEARWQFRDVHRLPRTFKQPRWNGDPLEGSRILLHAEQGLGDTIQFSRYAAMVAARGGQIVLEVQPPVERLMRSLPVVRAGLAEVTTPGQPLPAFDCECPLMSLPAVFGTTTATVPWPGAYLAADPALAHEKLIAIPITHPGPRIGVAWAGNPAYKADSERSTRLDTFLPLLKIAGANWISLQKGDRCHDLAALPSEVRVHDGCSHDRDLAETAAVIATLDLVITTDTSIAHLAGAMAKPVWILLPHLADWRWLQRTDVTPWYPTARLMRQRSRGDWPGLIELVTRELEAWLLERQGWLRPLLRPLRDWLARAA
jgi:tetratricopeptide (TPR) repeat protein